MQNKTVTDPSHPAPDALVAIGKSLVDHCRADSRCLLNTVAALLLYLVGSADVDVECLIDSICEAYDQVGR